MVPGSLRSRLLRIRAVDYSWCLGLAEPSSLRSSAGGHRSDRRQRASDRLGARIGVRVRQPFARWGILNNTVDVWVTSQPEDSLFLGEEQAGLFVLRRKKEKGASVSSLTSDAPRHDSLHLVQRSWRQQRGSVGSCSRCQVVLAHARLLLSWLLFHPPLPPVPLLTACTASSDVFPYRSSNASSPSVPISIGALVSICFTLDTECVVTLSMMMISSAMSNSSFMAMWCRGVDSSANSRASTLLICKESSLRLGYSQNLPSYLFVSLMKFPRMSSSCSTCFARSRSLMLLISAAHAEPRSDVIVSPDDQVPSFKSSLTLCLLNHFQWFVCCRPV